MAKAVLPHLVPFSRDRDPGVRIRTIGALGAIGREAKDLLCEMFPAEGDADQAMIDILIQLLKPDMDPTGAEQLLQKYNARGSNAMHSLIVLLIDRSEKTLVKSGPLLQALNVTSKAAIPELITLIKHRNPYMRAKACYALSLMNGDPHPIVPALVQALYDPECVVRCNAVEALGAYGSNAVTAAAKLKDMTNATNRVERFAVQAALRRIHPEAGAEAGEPRSN